MTKTMTYESKELYEALGKFITSFAELEHWLSCLLGVLTDDKENMWVTLFFIDELMTGRVRHKIHSVANLRLEDNESLLNKLKATLGDLEKLTTERNSLVHGQWVFNFPITKLHNYRLKKIKTKEGGCYWQHLDDKSVRPKDLRELTEESEKLADDLEDLRGEIEEYLEAEEK